MDKKEFSGCLKGSAVLHRTPNIMSKRGRGKSLTGSSLDRASVESSPKASPVSTRTRKSALPDPSPAALQLESLDLSDNALTGDALGTLVDCLVAANQVNPSLKELNLSYNHLSDADCQAVATLILSVPSLKKINLSGTAMSPMGLVVVANAIKTASIGGLSQLGAAPIGAFVLQQQQASSDRLSTPVDFSFHVPPTTALGQALAAGITFGSPAPLNTQLLSPYAPLNPLTPLGSPSAWFGSPAPNQPFFQSQTLASTPSTPSKSPTTTFEAFNSDSPSNERLASLAPHFDSAQIAGLPMDPFYSIHPSTANFVVSLVLDPKNVVNPNAFSRTVKGEGLFPLPAKLPPNTCLILRCYEITKEGTQMQFVQPAEHRLEGIFQISLNGKAMTVPKAPNISLRAQDPYIVFPANFCKSGTNALSILSITTKLMFVIGQWGQENKRRDIAHRIRTNQVLTYKESKALVLRSFQSSDSEIRLTSSRVSLRDPVLLTAIETPVRTQKCSHPQPFDLFAFLKLNEQHRTWRCPICQTPATLDLIFIDTFWKPVLAQLTKATDCVLFSDGEVRPDNDDSSDGDDTE